MQKRGFLFLLAATILLVAVAAYALISGPRAVATTAPSQRVFPDLASRLGDLAWMRLSRGQTKTDFTSVGDRWVLVEKGNYPAAPAKVRQLLLGLAELTPVEPKTAKTELFGRLDLDDPSIGKSTQITLRDRTGNTVAELIVGKVRRDRLGGGADGVYIRKPGESRTWLARGSFDLPDDGVAGWLDRRILDIPPARIASVTLAGGDGPTLVLKREAPGGKFAVADPPDGATFKPDALAEPATALAGLDLDDVKPAAELAMPDGVATAEFTTFDGLTAKLRIVTQDGVDWVTVEASGSGAAEADGKAINDKVARWAYAIPAQRAKLLRTRLADLTEPAKG
jgi:hypothetical protein